MNVYKQISGAVSPGMRGPGQSQPARHSLMSNLSQYSFPKTPTPALHQPVQAQPRDRGSANSMEIRLAQERGRAALPQARVLAFNVSTQGDLNQTRTENSMLTRDTSRDRMMTYTRTEEDSILVRRYAELQSEYEKTQAENRTLSEMLAASVREGEQLRAVASKEDLLINAVSNAKRQWAEVAPRLEEMSRKYNEVLGRWASTAEESSKATCDYYKQSMMYERRLIELEREQYTQDMPEETHRTPTTAVRVKQSAMNGISSPVSSRNPFESRSVLRSIDPNRSEKIRSPSVHEKPTSYSENLLTEMAKKLRSMNEEREGLVKLVQENRKTAEILSQFGETTKMLVEARKCEEASEAKLQQLAQQNAQREVRCDELEINLADMRAKLEECRTNHSRELAAIGENYNKNLSELMSLTNELRANLQAMKKSHEEAEQKNVSLEEQMRQIRLNCEDLTSQLAQKDAEKAAVDGRLAMVVDQNRQLLGRIGVLQQENITLHQSMLKVGGKPDILGGKSEDLEVFRLKEDLFKD